jgi:hypothetical protein
MPNIVGYWRAKNAVTGTGNVTDLTGRGNDGTMVNMVDAKIVNSSPRTPFDIENNNQGSFYFNGTTQKVVIPNSANLTFTDGAGNDEPFSISMWIKTSDLRNGIAINKANELLIAGNNSSQLYIRLYTDASNYISARATLAYASGNWRHYVITYDGSKTLAGFKIYYHGVPQGIADGGTLGTYTGMQNSGNNIDLGDTTTMNMCHVTYFDRVLTPCEVAEIDNDGSPIDILNFTGISSGISHWRLDKTDSATTSGGVEDIIGSNDGTAQNMTSSNVQDTYPAN